MGWSRSLVFCNICSFSLPTSSIIVLHQQCLVLRPELTLFLFLSRIRFPLIIRCTRPRLILGLVRRWVGVIRLFTRCSMREFLPFISRLITSAIFTTTFIISLSLCVLSTFSSTPNGSSYTKILLLLCCFQRGIWTFMLYWTKFSRYPMNMDCSYQWIDLPSWHFTWWI